MVLKEAQLSDILLYIHWKKNSFNSIACSCHNHTDLLVPKSWNEETHSEKEKEDNDFAVKEDPPPIKGQSDVFHLSFFGKKSHIHAFFIRIYSIRISVWKRLKLYEYLKKIPRMSLINKILSKTKKIINNNEAKTELYLLTFFS